MTAPPLSPNKRIRARWNKLTALLSFILLAGLMPIANAHHVLGRPAYSLNEDSNTPPSMNIETLVGEFFVTAMVFPAFPKPEEAGRINLYVTRLKTKQPLNADIEFSVRNNGRFRAIWFKNPSSWAHKFSMTTSTARALAFTSSVTILLAPHFGIRANTTLSTSPCGSARHLL